MKHEICNSAVGHFVGEKFKYIQKEDVEHRCIQGLLSIAVQMEDLAQEVGWRNEYTCSYILSSSNHCIRHYQTEDSGFGRYHCVIQCDCPYVKIHLSVLSV